MKDYDIDIKAELPRYKCHKEVHAIKIRRIEYACDYCATPQNCETDNSALLIPIEDGFAPIRVSIEYLEKHQPEAGGYYVVYEDGYKSYSPAKAFELGYTRIAAQQRPAIIKMQKFRKKPVVVEAMQVTDEWFDNPQVPLAEMDSSNISVRTKNCVEITTLEGIMTARLGDWIIRGINGEYYPCKPDIFDKTYEPL